MQNLNAIKKRIASIKATQKITNAMRLVSISKVNKYKQQLMDLKPYYDEIMSIAENFDSKRLPNDKQKLYLVFAPDLSLASAYLNSLYKVIDELEQGSFYWIGTQGNQYQIGLGRDILNEKLSSDKLDLESLILTIQEKSEIYNVIIITPNLNNGTQLDLKFVQTDLNVNLAYNYDDVYYPKYDAVQVRYQELLLKAMIHYTFNVAKYSEYTTRRIAMESATNNANEMIDNLQLVYNRVRQEAITQEISELISAMEA